MTDGPHLCINTLLPIKSSQYISLSIYWHWSLLMISDHIQLQEFDKYRLALISIGHWSRDFSLVVLPCTSMYSIIWRGNQSIVTCTSPPGTQWAQKFPTNSAWYSRWSVLQKGSSFWVSCTPLEQILSGSKHLGMVPEDLYIPKFWQSIILFPKKCNENLKMAP